eukprot:EG_transcript_3552
MTVEHEPAVPWPPANGHMNGHSNGDHDLLSKEKRVKYIEMGRQKLSEFKHAQEDVLRRLQAKEQEAAATASTVRQHEETLQKAVQQIAELSSAVTERDQQLQILANELQQWHEQWQVVSAEMTNLQTGVAQRDAALAAAQAELAAQREACVQARTKSKDELVCDMQDEVCKLEEELLGARERTAHLQQEAQALNAQLQHEQAQKEAYRKLVEERDELIEQLSTHHGHGEDQELELQALRVKLEQKEETIVSLHTQVDARDTQIMQLQHQEQELRQTQVALEERAQQLTQDMETLLMQLTEMKENRLEEKAMVDQMARQLEAANQQKADLEKEMSNAKHRLAVLSAKSEFGSRGGGMSEEFLVEELEAARAQAHQLATDLFELQQKYEEESLRWRTIQGEWETQQQLLRQEAEFAREAASAAAASAAPPAPSGPPPELLAELERKERDRQEAVSLAESRTAQLEQLQNELVALQAGAAEIHLQLQESQQQVAVLAKDNAALRAQLVPSPPQADLHEADHRVAELHAELGRAREYSDLLASTIQQLREELQRHEQEAAVRRATTPTHDLPTRFPTPPPPPHPPVPEPWANVYPPVPEPEPAVSALNGPPDAEAALPVRPASLEAAHLPELPEEPREAATPLAHGVTVRAGTDPNRQRSIPRPVSTKSTATHIPQHQTLFSVILIQSIVSFFTGKSWRRREEEEVPL